jgi:hypothetical protein
VQANKIFKIIPSRIFCRRREICSDSFYICCGFQRKYYVNDFETLFKGIKLKLKKSEQENYKIITLT